MEAEELVFEFQKHVGVYINDDEEGKVLVDQLIMLANQGKSIAQLEDWFCSEWGGEGYTPAWKAWGASLPGGRGAD